MPGIDQGANFDRYAIIPRVLIFIFNDEDVLLIKGAPTKRLWANRYNGLGGHIERGEDVLTAARRELSEETGLDSIHLNLCGTVMVDARPDLGIGIFIFRGQTQTRQLQASTEGMPEWVRLNQIGQIPLVEDLPQLLPRVIAWKPGDEPFFARYFYDVDNRLNIEWGH